MFKKLLLTILWMLLTTIAPASVICQEMKPASENEKALLKKSEIIELISQAVQIPAQQQKEKIDQLWAADGDSATPRSDFLYCSAFAYLGNPKAQACLGRAFENGRGVVSDFTDAYVWYTITLGNLTDDTEFRKTIEAAQTRVKMTLLSVYPSPSDFELEEAVEKQKENIEEYSTEAGTFGH